MGSRGKLTPTFPANREMSSGTSLSNLYAWGQATVGQFGILDDVNGVFPLAQQMKGSLGKRWDAIAPHDLSVLGISDGKLYGWGDNSNGITGLNADTDITLAPTQVGSFSDWTHVVTGQEQALGIRDEKLYSWGSNLNGRTGLNTDVGNTLVPTQVGSFSDWTHISSALGVSFGIRDGGKLYSWGGNGFGATGLNTTVGNTLVPTQVGSFSDWTHVAAGNRRSVGIRDGKLYAWGSNANGATGQNTTVGNTLVPTQIGTDTGWTFAESESLGTRGRMFGIRDGQLYAWGSNREFGTGLNIAGTSDQLVPTQVGTDTGWTDVSHRNVGPETMALGINDGKIYVWGRTESVRSGLDEYSETLRQVPTRIDGLPDTLNFKSVKIERVNGWAILDD